MSAWQNFSTFFSSLLTRRRQRHLLQRLNLLRPIPHPEPWPCTDRDAPYVLQREIQLAAEQGQSPNLAEILRRTGVIIYEEENLASICGVEVRLMPCSNGFWFLLLDAQISGFSTRVAMAWALERRVSRSRPTVYEIPRIDSLTRAVLTTPNHPLLQILLPKTAILRAQSIHGSNLESIARRLRVPSSLLASAQT